MEKNDTAKFESDVDSEYVKTWGTVPFLTYKHGAKVKWEPVSREGQAPPRGDRGAIRDQSRRSRHSCAFAFGNAECDWYATSLLTWRFPPAGREVKRAVRRLRDRWRARWGEAIDAWLMEMQVRGVPHFHLFHATDSNFGIACRAGSLETQTVRGTNVEVIRGGADFWLRDAWMDCIGCSDEETRHFNSLRMIQKLRHPDAAGRYAAKEAAKREQKALPEEYSEGLGQWWWLNPRWKPRVRHRGMMDVSFWPWSSPLAHVWDASDLTPGVVSVEHPIPHFCTGTGKSWLAFDDENAEGAA